MQNYTGAFLLLFLLIIITFIDGQANKEGKQQQRKTSGKTSFVDYIAKYDPKNVKERIDEEQKLKGLRLTDAQYIDAMFDGMDPTDKLLSIKVQNGDARMAVHNTGRRFWVPPRGVGIYHKDLFSLRPRFFELMKQSIYQARNKMIIMQNLRKKYRNSSLYKMGYLMSKTDTACLTFAKFTYRAYKLCHLAKDETVYRVFLYDILVCEERILSLWFTVDLLVDVLNKNDELCREVIKKYDSDRINHWKFVD